MCIGMAVADFADESKQKSSTGQFILKLFNGHAHNASVDPCCVLLIADVQHQLRQQ